jgi:hypothetical protein
VPGGPTRDGRERRFGSARGNADQPSNDATNQKQISLDRIECLYSSEYLASRILPQSRHLDSLTAKKNWRQLQIECFK